MAALMLVGCKDPEHPEPEITPCFTVVEDSFRDPREPVQFVNCSEGASDYHWDFGDGQTSTEEHPSHTFASTGYFDVRLAAQEGDWQEVMVKQVRVDYPRFKGVRVLQMPVISPRTGQPYDQGAAGMDLLFQLIRPGEHFPATGSFDINATIPHDFVLGPDESIEGHDWIILFECWDSGSADTIAVGTITFADLIGSSTYVLQSDSLLLSIMMEGVR